MLCFCRQKFEEESYYEFIKNRETYFNKYRADNYPEEKDQEALTEHCNLWFQTYLYRNALALGPPIILMILLNLAKPVIYFISKYEEHQTSDL